MASELLAPNRTEIESRSVDSILIKRPTTLFSEQGLPLVFLVVTKGDKCQAFLAEESSDLTSVATGTRLSISAIKVEPLEKRLVIVCHDEVFRCVQEFTGLVVVADVRDFDTLSKVGAGVSPLALIDIIFKDTDQQIEDNTVDFNPKKDPFKINAKDFLLAMANLNIEPQPAAQDLIRVTAPVYDNARTDELRQLLVFVEHLTNVGGNPSTAEELPLSRPSILMNQICEQLRPLSIDYPQLYKQKLKEIQQNQNRTVTFADRVKSFLNKAPADSRVLETHISYTLKEIHDLAIQLLSINLRQVVRVENKPIVPPHPKTMPLRPKMTVEPNPQTDQTINTIDFAKYPQAILEMLSDQSYQLRLSQQVSRQTSHRYEDEEDRNSQRQMLRDDELGRHLYFDLPIDEGDAARELQILFTDVNPRAILTTKFIPSLPPDTILVIVKDTRSGECRLKKLGTSEACKIALISDKAVTEIIIGYGKQLERGYYEKDAGPLIIVCGGRLCKLNLDGRQDEGVVVRDLSKDERGKNLRRLVEIKEVSLYDAQIRLASIGDR